MKKFVCKVCGYIYEGEAAPAECPVCHAKSNMFEEVVGELKLAAEHEFGVYETTVRDNDKISAEDKAYMRCSGLPRNSPERTGEKTMSSATCEPWTAK